MDRSAPGLGLRQLHPELQATIYGLLGLNSRQRLAGTCSFFRSLWLAQPPSASAAQCDRARHCMQQASAVVRELKPRLLIYRRNRATRIGSPLHEKLVARQPNYAGQIKHVYAALHVGAVQERLLLPDKEWTSVLALGMSNWLTNKLAKLQGSSLFITLVVEHYAPALTADQLATLEKIFEQVPKKLQTLHATRFSFDKRWRLISAQGQTLPMFWMTHDCVAGFPFEGFDGLDTNSSLPLEVLISRQ